jgi:hypothetical protein
MFYKKNVIHEYLLISADTSIFVDYPPSGYPHGYGADTYIIFLQGSGHEYHTIRVHGYPLTFLLLTIKLTSRAGPEPVQEDPQH